MSAANVATDGKIRALGPRPQPDRVVTEDDVKDPSKLTQMLASLLKSVAELRRTWAPRRLDFEDILTTTGPGVIRLQHNFGGRVRWWPIDYRISGSAAAPILQRDSAKTDDNTLVLLSYSTGLISIRVEEAG